MEAIEVIVGRMESEMQEWGAQIDDLIASRPGAGVADRMDLDVHVRELRSKFLLLRLRIEASRIAGHDCWDVFREGIAVAWSDLHDAMRQPIQTNANPAAPWDDPQWRAQVHLERIQTNELREDA